MWCKHNNSTININKHELTVLAGWASPELSSAPSKSTITHQLVIPAIGYTVNETSRVSWWYSISKPTLYNANSFFLVPVSSARKLKSESTNLINRSFQFRPQRYRVNIITVLWHLQPPWILDTVRVGSIEVLIKYWQGLTAIIWNNRHCAVQASCRETNNISADLKVVFRSVNE